MPTSCYFPKFTLRCHFEIFQTFSTGHVNGSELGTSITNDGSGFVGHDLNEASPNPPPSRGKQLHLPEWDETSSSSSTSSNLFDKKPPAKDNLSMTQEQTQETLTKHTSSSSSVSVPLCCGKQLTN